MYSNHTMYNPFTLSDKTVLITGASSGIGRAAAIECSKLGAKVIITARNKERLGETLTMMEGEDHSLITCDLCNDDEVDALVDSLPEIQGLVNNAGYTKLQPVQFITKEDFSNILNVNTSAPIILLQKLLRKRKLRKGASVVFTSSLAGTGVCTVGNSMYTASKGALSAFIRCAALELAPKQIRVNAVCPGMIDTGIISTDIVSAQQIEDDKKNYPLGRYGMPNDVAWAMIYLLSDASAWVTGDNLIIDGGLTLK